MRRSSAALMLAYFFLSVLCLQMCKGQGPLNARVVKTKQGSVKGVLVIPSNRDLQPVEAFLGIPYASPPVSALRFMPPISPMPWHGVRLMDKYGPACPQTLPDVSNEKEALRFVTRGRLQYLRRLLPYLRNQSEDCLYLNIYAPVTVGGRDLNIKFPVIVFIHGESYEWNSGNPYDGSILASYGDVIVVTLNFRLGVLGFLRPDLGENKVANFGLLDQIAALKWIQDNIGVFNGDRDSVTLLGHGTGAACVNLLLISPMAQSPTGLFHRAILMSGTALADWAISDSPLRYTLQAAQQVNCPLAEREDELATCLRFKKVTDLMSVRLQAPLYANPLAPLVDGIVVPNEPRQSMKTYNELFGRYDIMYGVTQSESFHLLNEATLQSGLTEMERNRIIRTYVRNTYASNIDQITAAILNEYTDWKNPIRDTEDFRDSILEILSDARVAAPVNQMGDLHSSLRERSYFYVFAHQTSNGDFPQSWGSIHGEELAYVFGMPLVGGTNHLTMNYTRAEMLLSEMIITYWTNFARTGNPNYPPRQKFLSTNPRDRFEPSYVMWPGYDRHSQKYLNIELRPKVKDHHRADKMALWSKLIPELLTNAINDKVTANVDVEGDLMILPSGGFRPIIPFPLPTDNTKSYPSENIPPARVFNPPTTEIKDIIVPMGPIGNVSSSMDGEFGQNGSIALSIVVVIGICFLVLNVCACAGVFYQRDRVRFKETLLQRHYKLRPAGRSSPVALSDNNDKDDTIPMSLFKTSRGRNQYNRSANDEESADELPQSLPHQASTSTMDPHTKVSQWMAQEVQPPSSHFQSRTVTNGTSESDLKCYDPSSVSKLSIKSSKEPDSSILVTLKEEKHLKDKESMKSSVTFASKKKSTATIGTDTDQPITCIGPVNVPSSSLRRSSTARRKSRAKSHPSRRDIGVGEDNVTKEEGDQDSPSGGTMDTIRRLNLPKVLPDLPSDQINTVYATPVDRQQRPPSQYDVVNSPPLSTIYKSNLPQKMVVAPHPRLARTIPTTRVNTEPVEEPELTVRPGPRLETSSGYSSQVCSPQVGASGTDVVLRRPKQSAGFRPASNNSNSSNRNSRSWYAQYSQSFISKSIDQEGEDAAT